MPSKKYKHSQVKSGESMVKRYTATYVILDLETNFVYIRIVRGFIAMDSPLKLASRQQLVYSTIWLFYCYCVLCQAQVSSYPYWKECISFDLHQIESIVYYHQTNHIHTQILYSKCFISISVMSLCW